MTPFALWMRHGTCADGVNLPEAHTRPDSLLAVCGAVEAERAARRFVHEGQQPALVIPSPLPRARQTATIVASILDVPLAKPLGVLAEWRAPDCVLGLPPAQYPPSYIAWRQQRSQQPDTALPGGESLRAFAARAGDADALARTLAREHGVVLIVSHRLLIGAVAALHRGHRDPADIFAVAHDFPLAPTQVWTPPQETPT